MIVAREGKVVIEKRGKWFINSETRIWRTKPVKYWLDWPEISDELLKYFPMMEKYEVEQVDSGYYYIAEVQHPTKGKFYIIRHEYSAEGEYKIDYLLAKQVVLPSKYDEGRVSLSKSRKKFL